MALNREAAVAALFARLTDPAGTLAGLIVTSSRAYKLPTEVQAEQQPALFLVTNEYEQYNPNGGRRPLQLGHPLTQIIRCTAIVYASQMAEDTNPEGHLLNPIIDAVEEALAFKPGTDVGDERGTECTNLGGVVESCTFGADPIAVVAGTGALQATVLLPIEMLITKGR